MPKDLNVKIGTAEARQRLMKDFQNLSDEMENLLNGFFKDKRRSLPCTARGFVPAMDVFETETEIVCLLELVGVKPTDLTVKVEAGMLFVTGVRRELEGFDRRHYHKMELEFGAFERRLTLPEPIIADSLRLESEYGFYTIRLRKVFPGLKPSSAVIDSADLDPRR